MDQLPRPVGLAMHRPHRAGRVVAVADVTDPMTFYFGAVAGGVWKTTDGGTTWANVSDGYFGTAAVGAVTVSWSDPNVLYVGTGEATIRGNVSHGDGVYKSTDGGKSWRNVGLKETRHIAKIRIHPTNPDIAYVAAFGHAWGPNPERGVYRTTDGGKHWELVLHKSERAGAIDLTMDPHNPRILYAAIWHAQRHPHTLVSGGEDSGIWRSTDGGDTWQEITRNEGLPTGILGKIGLAISPSRQDRIYAIVEAEDGAVFRSDDGGETWQRMNDSEMYLRTRAWYYMHLIADPQDANTVWVLNFSVWRSIDGGATFKQVSTPHGDNHDLWIDPQNPRRMIRGNDGGACVTFNGGQSWTIPYNQPTAQLYHVTTDDRFPYRVYGSQQDNTAISVPSATVEGIIHTRDWFEPGGGESGYIAVKPDDPDLIVASGPISKRAFNDRMLLFDRRTGQKRNITVWPELHGWSQGAEMLKYRFQWTFPILFSRHNPDELYVAGNILFRSTDLGTTWEALSPDLTRNDPEKLRASGGPITRDNTGAEVYCTIFALAESPNEAGVFWAGSDDGLVHLTRDGGKHWEQITPPTEMLPEWALISFIEASPHDPATAYLAATRYKHDDTRPYLLKTTDWGKTWVPIVDGIPGDDFTRVIRADPERAGLLYAGTETGIYVSFDDGGAWHRLGGNLPVVPIHDLVIKNDDLVVATHGRSFWILDDVSPLREVGAGDWESATGAHLFSPRPAVRFRVGAGWSLEAEPGQHAYGMSSTVIYSGHQRRRDGKLVTQLDDVGENPPAGAILHFALGETVEDAPTLRILDGAGQLLRELKDVPKVAGVHRVVWDLRARGVEHEIDGPDLETVERPSGPMVLPGRYTVELRVGERALRREIEVRPDPRIGTSRDDLQSQYDLLIQIRDRLSETNALVNQIRGLKRQVEAWEGRFAGQAVQERGQGVREAATRLREELGQIERELVDVRSKSPLLFKYGLHEKLSGLYESVDSADYRPVANAYPAFEELVAKLNEQEGRFESVIAEHGGALNRAIAATGVPAIAIVE
ncbi:MAG: glycosyl hydrolase [Chloroflexia bacterium]